MMGNQFGIIVEWQALTKYTTRWKSKYRGLNFSPRFNTFIAESA